MAFSEALKKEVRRKAHLKCCICESFEFLHVHHIIPEKEGGPDTIDNAAPLCSRCHDAYGGNPERKKWIREKRDLWYEICEKKLSNEDVKKIEEIREIIENTANQQKEKISDLQKSITLLQGEVSAFTEQNRELVSRIDITPKEERDDLYTQVSSISSVVTSSASALNQMNNIFNNYRPLVCPSCGRTEFVESGYGLVNQKACPNCGSTMR